MRCAIKVFDINWCLKSHDNDVIMRRIFHNRKFITYYLLLTWLCCILQGWTYSPGIRINKNTGIKSSPSSYSSIGDKTRIKDKFGSPTELSTSSNHKLPVIPTNPVLKAQVSATVDAPFIATFADDASWRAAITSITVGGITLAKSAYVITAGQILFIPSASTLLQRSAILVIYVYATGYSNAFLSQFIGAGADTKLAVATQPATPAVIGGIFGVQPVITILDQYNNVTNSTATVTASIGSGVWALGGKTNVKAVAGNVTFTNLTASNSSGTGNASLVFSSNGLTGVTSNFFSIPPIYDLCSGALIIPWLGSVSADNSNANNESFGGSPCSVSPNGRTKAIWFKTTPPVSGTISITACGATGLDVFLRVYTGSCTSFQSCAGYAVDNIICVNGQTSAAVTFTATANTTYYVLCGLYDNSKSCGPVTLSVFPVALAPVLTAAEGATVDADFSIKFTDNANWRNAITAVLYGSFLLQPDIDYSVTPGAIILKPGGTNRGPLSKATIQFVSVLAAGYSYTHVTQSILHGIPALVTVATQPVGPATNGGVFVKQPVVTVTDQYGNFYGAGAIVKAVVTKGQEDIWSLDGTVAATSNASSVATFSDLTATNKTGVAYPASTITFSTGTGIITSAGFTLPPHAAILPSVTSQTVTSITSSTAISGGNVTMDGYTTVTQRGIVWNVLPAPVITLTSKTMDGPGAGVFGSSMNSLIGNTKYYYRAYATNKVGTGYGTENNFITLPAPPVLMAATNSTATGFIARWNKTVQGSALSAVYEIQVSTSPVDFSSPVAVITGIAEIADPQLCPVNEGLHDGVTYYYRVRCITSAGNSDWSAISAPVNLPLITLIANDDGTQDIPGNIARNSIDNILSKIKLVVSNGNGIVSGIAFTTPGMDGNCNYTNSDISGFKLWYSVTNDFSAKTQLGVTLSSRKTDPVSMEALSFSSLSLSLPANTYYFWVTANVLKTAVAGNTIIINAPVFTAETGTVTNGCHNTGKQTIVFGERVNLYLRSDLGSPLAVTDSHNWTAIPDGSSGEDTGDIQANDIIWNIRNVNGLLDANWNLGSNSKVVVGDGIANVRFTINAGAGLVTNGAGVDVSSKADLAVFSRNMPLLGSLSTGSTVSYLSDTDQAIQGAAYYNLTIGGSGCKTLTQDMIVNEMLAIRSATLAIGPHLLTITSKDGQISGAGFIKSSAGSDLLIQSSNLNAGTLNFDQSADGVTNTIHSLTVNCEGTIRLGNTLHITSGGMLNVKAGDLDLAGQHLILDGNVNTGLATIPPVTGAILGATNVTVNLPLDNWGSKGKWTQSSTCSGPGVWRCITLPLRANGNTINLDALQSYIYITGPSGANLDHIGGVTGNSYSCYRYAGALDSPWVAVTDPFREPLLMNTTAGDGGNQSFLIYIQGPRDSIRSVMDNPVAVTLPATGVLQTGDVNFTFNKLNRGQFALVGNPYISPVDFNSPNLIVKGAKKQLWLWDPTVAGIHNTGKYNIVDGLTSTSTEAVNGSAVCNILQPGQAFFLQADGTNNGLIQVTFKETCKACNAGFVNTMGLPTQNGTYKYVKIGLDYMKPDNTPQTIDGLLALYNNAFSADIEDEDIVKFPDVNNVLCFKRNGASLGLEGRPVITNTDTLFINFDNKLSNGDYRFRITCQSFQSTGLLCWLEDNYLQNRQPVSLTEGDTSNLIFNINNNIPASCNANRFRLVFNAPGTPLALSLLNISATQQNDCITVNWNATGENAVMSYDLEHSIDGVIFNKIGNVRVGNNPDVNYYKWTDPNPLNGVNYYRLKILYTSDTAIFSRIVKITYIYNTKPGIILYPNPMSGNTVLLQFNNLPADSYSVTLYSETGRQITKEIITHAGGNSVITIRLPLKIASGLYHLKVSGLKGGQYLGKLIVQ